MTVNLIKNVFLVHARTHVLSEEFVELTLNVLLKIAKHLAYAFQVILEMQDQYVKNLELYHVRKILVEQTVIV
jgi:hypothetical protein